MIKVCDALCGAGKTSACIRMMNERVDSKFIFVTQYLSEVDRIKSCCGSRGFVSPESDGKTKRTKLADVRSLLAQGENVATTHSLFLSYTDEVKDLICGQNYILVLDEVVDVLYQAETCKTDVDLLKRANAVTEDECGAIAWNCDSYDYTDERARFREEAMLARSKNFNRMDDNFYFWSIPPELFSCFSEVYILTYMFRAQSLRSFFEVHNIQYELIGVKHDGEAYGFCPVSEMDRKRELRDKIHVFNKKKINAIGDKRTSLSYSWYVNAPKLSERSPLISLRNNITNVFRNIFNAKSDDTLWTTFKEYERYLSNKGHRSSFIPCNMRASNDYADRHYLAYCVNNFPRPWEYNYYKMNGSTMDADMYGLSVLIQWVFRSAIRKGEEVWIYIPSARMRNMFLEWLDNLAEGRDLDTIIYQNPNNGGRNPSKTRVKKPPQKKKSKSRSLCKNDVAPYGLKINKSTEENINE